MTAQAGGVRPLDAVSVLNLHADAAASMQHPSAVLTRFIGYHLRKGVENQWKDGRGTQGCFHPVVKIGDTGLPGIEQGEQMARLIGRSLGRAVTYQVTSRMVDSMRAAFDAGMTREIERLDDHYLPGPAGFAWLDSPWRIPDGEGDAFHIRALSWEFTEAWRLRDVITPEDVGKLPGVEDNLWPCVRICAWRHDMDADIDDASAALGPLTLTHTALMPFRLRFIEDTPEGMASSEALIGLIHLLWVYLGTEISGHEQRGVPSGVRRSARRSIKHPQVKVVLLRKVRPQPDHEPGHRDVSWSCRWPVDQHYRHRERPEDRHKAKVAAGMDKHCLTCGKEIFLVREYLKGPPGMPLRRPAKTLMKLAR